MAFTPINTQEEFDAAIKDRIERLSKKYEGYTSPEDLAKMKKNYDDQIASLNQTIKDSADKYSNYDKLMEEKDAQIKGYETASVKTRIAHEKGLPYDSIGFLSGDNEETIGKSADALKTLIGSSHTAPPMQTEPNNLNSDMAGFKQLLNQLKGE